MKILILITCFLFFTSPLYAIEDRELLMEEARHLSWNKEYESAIVIYQKLLEKNPDDIEAAMGHAKVRAWSGDYEKAVKLYKEILKKDPNNKGALLELGRTLLWQGKYKESLKTLDQLLAIDPDNKEILELKKKVRKAREVDKHFKVRAGFHYQDISFTSNAPGANFIFIYDEPRKWGVRGGFDYVNKFGDSAPGYMVGGTYWPTEGTTLSLDIEFAPKQDVVPLQAYTFEVSQKVFKVLVPSLSYRFADYEAARAHIVMPGLTWYFYQFDWMARYILSISLFGGQSHINNSMMTRLTWSPLDLFRIFAGYARASESFESGNPINPFGAFSANHVFGVIGIVLLLVGIE